MTTSYAISTYETYIDINGYQYELKVDYSFPFNDFEIQDVKIKNDAGEWVKWPYLEKVENEIEEHIKEELNADIMAQRDAAYSLDLDYKRGL